MALEKSSANGEFFGNTRKKYRMNEIDAKLEYAESYE